MGLYLAALIFSRMVLGKGLESLSVEDKGRFMEITNSVRKWSLIFLVVIISLFLIASRFGAFSFTLIFSAYIASLLLFNNGVIVVLILRKMKAAGMPEFFIKKYIAASLIKFLAVILVSAGVFYLLQTGKIPV